MNTTITHYDLFAGICVRFLFARGTDLGSTLSPSRSEISANVLSQGEYRWHSLSFRSQRAKCCSATVAVCRFSAIRWCIRASSAWHSPPTILNAASRHTWKSSMSFLSGQAAHSHRARLRLPNEQETEEEMAQGCAKTHATPPNGGKHGDGRDVASRRKAGGGSHTHCKNCGQYGSVALLIKRHGIFFCSRECADEFFRLIDNWRWAATSAPPVAL